MWSEHLELPEGFYTITYLVKNSYYNFIYYFLILRRIFKTFNLYQHYHYLPTLYVFFSSNVN